MTLFHRCSPWCGSSVFLLPLRLALASQADSVLQYFILQYFKISGLSFFFFGFNSSFVPNDTFRGSVGMFSQLGPCPPAPRTPRHFPTACGSPG